MAQPLSRSDLVLIVERLQSGELEEGEADELVARLERSVSHPDIMELVEDPTLDAEEVVDLALGYDPLNA